MTRIGFVHTMELDHWRVFPCLVMRESREFILDKLRRVGTLVYIDGAGGIRVKDYQHYADLTSAHYWVLQTEVKILWADIASDYEQRQLWRKSYEDAKEAMILSGIDFLAEPNSAVSVGMRNG